MSRILNQLDQERHYIDPSAVAGINSYSTEHLILLGQYHLDDARQQDEMHHDLAIHPPPEAA